MRIFRPIAAALCLMIAASPALAYREFGMAVVLRPDESGDSQQIQIVEMEDGEVKIERIGPDGESESVRPMTDADFEAALTLLRARMAAMTMQDAALNEVPHIEVEYGYSSDNASVKIREIYPVGALPEDYIRFQELIFGSAFQ